jgi:hypothetical protein
MGKKRQMRMIGKHVHTDSRHVFKIRDTRYHGGQNAPRVGISVCACPAFEWRQVLSACHRTAPTVNSVVGILSQKVCY